MFQHLANIRAGSLVFILLFLFSLVFVPSTTHTVVGANPNILYINPPQLGPFSAGTFITYQVKVANMDPFNTWDIQVKTDPTVLNPVSLTTSGNTLTANYSITEQELTNCINGSGSSCTPPADGLGVVHSAVFPLGSSPNVPSISGVLFNITYSVVKDTGVAGVLIFNDQIANNGPLVSHVTQNGIYGNAKLPVVDFYWTPAEPGLSQVNFFSNSSDPNPGGSIPSYGYSWNFDDGTGEHPKSGANITDIYTVKSGGTPLNNICGAALKFQVQLTVTDNFGISNSQTHILLIKPVRTYDLAADSIITTPADAVYAGTSLTIDVKVGELGTLDVNSFNVSVSVDHQPLRNGNATFDSTVAGSPLHCQQEKDFKFSWDTSGLSPRTYDIEVSVSPVRNATSPTHEILENVRNNMLTHIIRIIVPMGGSLLPFTMPESIAVGGVVIAGIILSRVAFSRNQLRKKRLGEEL
jgi:hypothetical protein